MSFLEKLGFKKKDTPQEIEIQIGELRQQLERAERELAAHTTDIEEGRKPSSPINMKTSQGLNLEVKGIKEKIQLLEEKLRMGEGAGTENISQQ